MRNENFSKIAIGDASPKKELVYIPHGWKIYESMKSFQKIFVSVKQYAVIIQNSV